MQLLNIHRVFESISTHQCPQVDAVSTLKLFVPRCVGQINTILEGQCSERLHCNLRHKAEASSAWLYLLLLRTCVHGKPGYETILACMHEHAQPGVKTYTHFVQSFPFEVSEKWS